MSLESIFALEPVTYVMTFGVLRRPFKTSVEGDITAVSIIGMDSCKIDSGRENFFDILDFVNQNINRPSVFRNGFAKMLAKNDRIAKVARLVLFKVNGYNVCAVYPSLPQIILEKIEKKKTLPASPNTGDELYEMMAFTLNEFVNNVFSFNCHHRPAFCLCVFSRKLKLLEVCHIGASVAIGTFNFCDTAFEKMVLEKIEQEKALPTSSDTCKDFDKIVFLGRDETIQKLLSHYDGMFFHFGCSFFFFSLLRLLKAVGLYHIRWRNVMETFDFGRKLQWRDLRPQEHCL